MTQVRLYDAMLTWHVGRYRQMAFLAGPRQVGKTTTCRGLADQCLDWDDQDHRDIILAGPKAVAAAGRLEAVQGRRPILAFDELHKYPRWKLFLKGFFDTHGEACRVLVTGSSRLDVYRRGGDSLMGRYFLYRMHPLSIGELLHPTMPEALSVAAQPLGNEAFKALWTHGGFPEPFLRRDPRFTRRWRDLRHQQLFCEDLRDLTRVQELDQIDALGRVLADRSGAEVSWRDLANQVRTSENTVRAWVTLLCSLHHGFLVRPYFRNLARALRKMPRYYLRDWSGVEDPGRRAETFVACHLLKAVETWTDCGLGRFDLHYLRDKDQREVDFLVTQGGKPFVLVEAKLNDTVLSPALAYYQQQTKAAHAFQAVIEADAVDADCFQRRDPVICPARTLLAQLP